MAKQGGAGALQQPATNRIASTDELDHYIKVANPSAWAVLVAALLLVIAIVVWAVVAIVPVTVETTGVTMEGGNVVCWVDQDTAKKIDVSGAKAKIGGVDGEVVSVSDIPMSASEVIKILGSDFYADSVDLASWNYVVTIKPQTAITSTSFAIESEIGELSLAPVSIVVMETQPINLIMGQK